MGSIQAQRGRPAGCPEDESYQRHSGGASGGVSLAFPVLRSILGFIAIGRFFSAGAKVSGGPITIRISRKKGCEDVPLPRYMSAHAAGMDLCAACESDVDVAPGQVKLVPCGFTMALPPGYEAQVRPRSGLALKHGLTLPNSPGTIDADYRGEVCVILGNIGPGPFTVTRGMRVAQMVVAPVTRAEVRVVETLDATARGDGGFGHTGLR